MIESLRIKDFQSIEELSVDCGPITVIHGESDTGKSAVVRALYALAFNSYPKGHVRDGADHSEIEVVAGRSTILAEKGGGHNDYRLDDGRGSADLWDKVGTDVPTQIVEELGWREVELDDGSRFTPNFQLQFDPPFLLTDSPSRRAKLLGSLTNVATLFAAVKMANTWERRSKNRIEAQEEIKARAIESAEQLERVVADQQGALQGLLAVVAQARQQHDAAKEKLVALMKTMQVVETVRVGEDLLEMLDNSVPDLERAEELIPRLQGLHAVYENVMAGEREVRKVQAVFEQRSEDLGWAEDNMREFMKVNKLCPLCGQSWDGHE